MSSSDRESGGILLWFASNPVLANFIMLILLFGGFLAFSNMNAEVFPDIDPGIITINVPYPGGTPYDVEEGITRRVEEAIVGVEGIERIQSVASEGMGQVLVEMSDFADEAQVLDDLETAVAQIVDFPPEEAEVAQVKQVRISMNLMALVLHGSASERVLKDAADRIRDDLLQHEDISLVQVSGVRDYEIAIEVSEKGLRRYGMTFDEVAGAVRNASLDLPAGTIRSDSGSISLRTQAQRYEGVEFASINVRSNSDGTDLFVGDVATVRDEFEDVDILTELNRGRAVFVNVSRTGDQDALTLESVVKEYIETYTLPPGLSLTVWGNQADLLRDRLSLILRNGAIGLFLVFVCLFMFLNLRLAFWTSMGIPISFMGAFLVLQSTDLTINMVSLFGLIVVLGIVVDDAIIIGESIFFRVESGERGLGAAVRGTREVAAPVIAGVATTIAAFAPLLFIQGVMGQVMGQIPLIVMAVLGVSLIEALIILPAHLNHLRASDAEGSRWSIQRWLRDRLREFVQRVYKPALIRFLRYRYLTMAGALGVSVLFFGAALGGFIPFNFMPDVDADELTIQIEMRAGTPYERTREATFRVLGAAEAVRERLAKLDAGTGSPPVYSSVVASVGDSAVTMNNPNPFQGIEGSHSAQVSLALAGGADRLHTTREIESLWNEAIGEIEGVESLSFTGMMFTAGEDVHVELVHSDLDVLEGATRGLKERLRQIEGVYEIADGGDDGNRELKFTLTEEGRSAGLTEAQLARQIRQAFYGEEVQRIQRGSNEVRVMVRYPREERRSLGQLDSMRIRLSDGTEIPLRTAAMIEEGEGYSTIHRVGGRRILSVTAKVDRGVTSSGRVNGYLRTVVLPELMEVYPGLVYQMEGQQREQQKTMRSMVQGLAVALLLIFGILGAQLRSYIQPLIIMAAIPFGVLGAVVGHLVLGYQMSMPSFFGIVALSGVVVNDALILIDSYNRNAGVMATHFEAVVAAGVRRFRPILFTTLTTALGLLPLMLETSIQARFLIPMAISLGFGIIMATGVTLVLVPSLVLIVEDVRAIFGATPQRTVAAEAGSGG